MLLEEFLTPMGISQRELATAINVPYQRSMRSSTVAADVTPSTALRLSKFFGTTADFWMNLQLHWISVKTNSLSAANSSASCPVSRRLR